jgi:hypothetical protein
MLARRASQVLFLFFAKKVSAPPLREAATPEFLLDWSSTTQIRNTAAITTMMERIKLAVDIKASFLSKKMPLTGDTFRCKKNFIIPAE